MSSLRDTHVPATFYLQVEPTWYGNGKLSGAKLARSSQNKPGRPIGGTVTVKLTVHVPKSAFLPLQPEAEVIIPEGMTETVQIEAHYPEDIDGAADS